jgi:hypothetical protein
MAVQVTKTADSKGRITFGKRFANKPVIIEEISETEVKVSLARVIPEREMWLWQNLQAQNTVNAAIDRLKRGEFAEEPPPDIDADENLANQLED